MVEPVQNKTEDKAESVADAMLARVASYTLRELGMGFSMRIHPNITGRVPNIQSFLSDIPFGLMPSALVKIGEALEMRENEIEFPQGYPEYVIEFTVEFKDQILSQDAYFAWAHPENEGCDKEALNKIKEHKRTIIAGVERDDVSADVVTFIDMLALDIYMFCEFIRKNKKRLMSDGQEAALGVVSFAMLHTIRTNGECFGKISESAELCVKYDKNIGYIKTARKDENGKEKED